MIKDIKKDFTIEQKLFIRSIIYQSEMSRVALVRRLIKTKNFYDNEMQLMIKDTVEKLCAMKDSEYSEYDFNLN